MNETEAALLSRRAVRGFLPTQVPRADVAHLLDVAARAPSGTNMQPWRAVALAGEPLRAFCAGVEATFRASGPEGAERAYYPGEFFEPYLARRRRIGWDLYRLLGIGRGERAKAADHVAKNLHFFGAPVGLICLIDRRLEIGSWLDYGFFLQALATAARVRGLDSCPMAVFAEFPRTIRRLLDLSESDMVLCGMAIGHEDTAAPANALRTERVPAREFCEFRGFAGDD
jgi:nitroreductase